MTDFLQLFFSGLATDKLLRKLADGGTTVHKRADELLADPNIERLFLGGAHAAASATV